MPRALPILLLLPLMLIACATPQVREAPRPRANPGARARYACQKMADDLLSARRSARILAVAGKTGRLYADDEALEPLEKCLKRLHPEDPLRARAVAHALGLLVRSSRLFDPDERADLLKVIPQPEIRALWLAWVLLDADRPADAAEAAAAPGSTDFRPLLLTRAEAELSRGDAEAAELALTQAGAADRPGLALELSVALAREQLVRADRALAAHRVAGPWEPAKKDPDALAVLAIPDAPPDADACTHGELRALRGDREGALERLRAGECDEPLVRLLLDDGRPFDALLHLRAAGVDAPALAARGYRDLGQPWAAGAVLHAARARCLRLGSEAACAHLQDDAASYAPRSSAPPAPAFSVVEAAAGPAPDGVALDDLGPLAELKLVLAVKERGRTVVVVASEQAPRGLYAFLLQGARRQGPYHLGLVPGGRYELVAEPAAPVFDGKALQLEARDAQEKRSVTLRFPLEALQKDADRDGWTDLLEAHLGTDPAARDTDGDGLADARDPLPLQPAAADTAGDALLRAALPALFEDAPESLLPEVRYLETPARLLSGKDLSRPVIALPEGDLALIPGARAFAALPALALDKDRTRGLVEIREDWRARRTVYQRDGQAYRPLPSAPASGKPTP